MSFLSYLFFPVFRGAADMYIDSRTPENLNFYKAQKEVLMYVTICFLDDSNDNGVKDNYSKIRTDISNIFDCEVSDETFDSFFTDIPENLKENDKFQEFIFQLLTYEQRLQILHCLFIAKKYSADQQQFDVFLLRTASFLKCRKADFINLKNESEEVHNNG